MPKRTAADLIAELQAIAAEGAGTGERAGLIIGFKNITTYVWAHEADALANLNEAIKVGGEPVGVVRLIRDGEKMVLEANPLQEYENDQKIWNYLQKLMVIAAKQW